MKILITGAAGYIGSILTPMLVERGHDVTVLDNFLWGQQSIGQLVRHANFHVHRVDVRDHAALKPYLAAPDVIIPLAALVGAPLCDLNPVDAELLNLRHPLALFRELSAEQIVVMPTTESSYGSNVDVCTEETPINPLSTYAKHKAEVEAALLTRENSSSLRLATVFGFSPRMRLDLLVNDFAWKAYKEHSIMLFEHHFRRTVVHVVDVARAFIWALEQNLRGVHNVGEVHLTKLSLCEEIKKKIPDFEYVLTRNKSDADQRNYQVSSAKLKATGFQFKYDLSDGLDQLIKGFPMLGNTRHGNMP